MKHKQIGFTLIELVSVIVILGVIAAVAVPRFTNLTTVSRIAAINGMVGAVTSAANIAYSQALATGRDCTQATGQSIIMQGQNVDLAYCYPASINSGGIDNAVNSSGFIFGYGTGTAVIEFKDSSGAGIVNCQVNYTQPTGFNNAPVIQTFTGSC